jgi:DNA-binding MarR family transcriptional regulator
VTSGPWLSDEEQCAWRTFLEMQRRLQAHLTRHLQRDFGLSGPDYEILVNLSESATGRMRAFELAESTQWEKSRLSHHLTRMEQRGLLRKECTDDTRYFDIVLTDEGREAIGKAAPQHAALVRTLFAEAIGADRIGDFADACRAVYQATEAHEDGCCPPTAC